MRKITKYPYYEVNFLKLGDADSIILAYQEAADSKFRLALIDAGNVDDSETIRLEILNTYNRTGVDVAVLTHPDKDHKGGFFGLSQSPKFSIGEFWLAEPWLRHPTPANKNDKTILIPTYDESKHIFNHPSDDKLNLLTLLFDKQAKGEIQVKDACQGKGPVSILPLTVVGPTLDFADRNAKIMVSEFAEIEDDKKMEEYVEDAVVDENRTKSAINAEPDDTSATNMSSVILLFDTGRKFLLTGDASRASINAMLDENEFRFKHCVLKVPHHGSKHNLNTDLIDRLAPEQSAICCAGTTKHPSKGVVYWLSKYGNVYSTHKGSFYYNSEVTINPAKPLKEKIKE